MTRMSTTIRRMTQSAISNQVLIAMCRTGSEIGLVVMVTLDGGG
jgi:hypothetical protein